MKKYIITFLLISISATTFSQTSDGFKYITTSVKKNEVYIQLERDNYNTKEFWLKITNPLKNTKGKNGKIVKTGGGYSLQYVIIYCSDKAYSVSNTVIYDRNNNPSKSPGDDVIIEKIVPGSIMIGVYEHLCKGR